MSRTKAQKYSRPWYSRKFILTSTGKVVPSLATSTASNVTRPSARTPGAISWNSPSSSGGTMSGTESDSSSSRL